MEEKQDTSSLSFKEHGDKDFLDGFQQVFGLGNQEGGSSVSSTSTTITETGGVKPPTSETEKSSSDESDENKQSQTKQSQEEDESEETEETDTSTGQEAEEGAEESSEEGTEGEQTGAEEESGEEPEESEESGSSAEESESDEAEIVDSFFDLFSQELGWEYKEGEKPQSISGLVDFMSDLMDKGSKPSFADEEVEKINNYVANGGKLEDYINAYGKDFDPNNIDVESSVENQKRVLREHLNQLGLSEDNVENKIQRYEDVGTLAEEAQESLELLKQNNERETEKLLREQENQRQKQEEQQQKVIEDVRNTIDSKKTVKGIPLTKKQKEDLKSYLLEADKSGMTSYQKDFSNSYDNLIESAFFTMQGDDIIKQLQRKANTDATKNLKNKLGKSKQKRSKGRSSGSSGGSGSSQAGSALETVSRLGSLLSE